MEEFFRTYTTRREVKIPSLTLKTIFLISSSLIMAYIIVYAVIMQGGYQRRCPIRSRVLERLEGVLLITASDVEIGLPVPLTQHIWDHTDVRLSSRTGHDSGSFFVLTNFATLSNQAPGSCPSTPTYGLGLQTHSARHLPAYNAENHAPFFEHQDENMLTSMNTKSGIDTTCHKDGDCGKAGRFLDDGLTTGRCVQAEDELDIHTCEIVGYCPRGPLIFPFQARRALLEDTKTFMSVIDNEVEFPACGPQFRRKNYLNYTSLAFRKYLQTCIYNPKSDRYCPRFRLGDVVAWAGANYSDVALTGGVFIIRITWECNFDWGKTIQDCLPVYSFHRQDQQEQASPLLGLGNTFSILTHEDEKRTRRHNVGIRFLIEVQGEGRMSNFLVLFLTAGAGVGFLGLAVHICDGLLFLFCFLRSRVHWSWLRKYSQHMKYDLTFVEAQEKKMNDIG